MTAPKHAAARRPRPIGWLLGVIAGIELWLHYWEWPVFQAHYRRQYRRADRKAFAAECDEIRAAAHVADMTPETPAAVSPCGAPEEAPVPLPPPLAGPGASPRRDTWVIAPPTGRHATATPRAAPADDTVPLRRLPSRPTGRPPWDPATPPACAVPDAGPRDEDGELLPVRVARYMDAEWLTARPVRFACRSAAIADVATSPGWDSAAVRRAATAPTQALAMIA